VKQPRSGCVASTCCAAGSRSPRAWTEVNGHTVFGTPKTHQECRVPVPAFVRDEIATLLADKRAEDLVFTSPRGDVLRLNNWRRNCFDAAAASVGLAGLTPHELRHTAASVAIASGAHVKAVQTMLGLESAAVTLDVYAGLFGDDLDTLAERLDAASRTASAGISRTERGLKVNALFDRDNAHAR
jgi:integrase